MEEGGGEPGGSLSRTGLESECPDVALDPEQRPLKPRKSFYPHPLLPGDQFAEACHLP